ncbi:dipeptide ABC transporter ATP-binding protein [Mycobacterium sp. C31M]
MTATSAEPVLPQIIPDTVLDVRDVSVAYGSGPAAAEVLHSVSLELGRGSTVALVGQSGSGKTTLARAVSGLLPAEGAITGGTITLRGSDVTGYRTKQWRPLRGSVIGYIPQDPLGSLDPLQRIGRHLARVIRWGEPDLGRAATRARIVELLGRVGIRNPAERAQAFPHQLSGGQLQRVLIATAIAREPALLIADEPTSALDVTVQRTILDLVEDLQRELGLAVLFVTHDLALASDRSDSVVVLRGGRVEEQGRTRAVLTRPGAEYTRRLVADAPALSPDKYAGRAVADGDDDDAIVVSGVTKRFRSTVSPGQTIAALDDVSFAVRSGSIHALVGESGSGKTTAARIVAGITAFGAGSVTVSGRELPRTLPPVNRHAEQLQLIYQNPLAAVNPKYTVRQILEEPLLIHGDRDRAERAAVVDRIIDDVALTRDLLGRRARELSGGQRQRVALARALVLSPQILVLDEPTSALDVSVQAQIVDLLVNIRAQRGLTYLFISHDLSLVRQIADAVTVLDNGRVVESGTTAQLFGNPASPVTRQLIDAIPGQLDRRAAS